MFIYICFILEEWSMGTRTSRNMEHLFLDSLEDHITSIYNSRLQFQCFFFQRCIVLVCSGQLFSTSVITTADSARMSIQDATETSWPDDLWNVLLENSVHCEFLYSFVLSVSSIHETWGFLGSLYHGVLCDKQCRPSKVVWLLGSRKQNHQDNQIFLAVD